ncbi:MAG: putative peptidoglycan glycosyltransferase FtsW [Rhodospirillales bacterium]
MSGLARTDTSIVGRWWWTVDRWSLAALLFLVAIGAILTLTASPPVAERIGLGGFHFVKRQFLFLPMAVALILAISLLDPRNIRRMATIGFIISLILAAMCLVIGPEIKGAQRWLNIGGFSIQPSEFIKPAFAVVAAWMFSEGRLKRDFPGHLICFGLYAVTAAVLLLQPDVGMTIVITAVWMAQFFLAGLSMIWVIGLIGLGIAGAVSAYLFIDHVQSRVDRFLNPESGDTFQITTALDGFRNGGLMGQGPGEGLYKLRLPDAHADFVFAVAGEEFGTIACILIVALFAFIVLRGFARVLREQNLFILLASAGLLTQFGLQSLVNMASSLHLMPTKGMTLPFISYGGSSVLALAIGMGMVLALTRRRVSGEEL